MKEWCLRGGATREVLVSRSHPFEALSRKFSDFQRAYTVDGISLQEFDSFGATRRTLRQSITACHDLDVLVRDFMLPNPDLS
jgi:transaldolase